MKQRRIRSIFLVILLVFTGLLISGCDGFLSVEIPPRDNPEDPLAESPDVTAEINIDLQGTSYSNGNSYDFGDIALGSLSPEVTFTITNNGNSTLYLTGDNPFSFSGGPSTAFDVQNVGSYAINPGASTTFSILFTSVSSAGSYNAVLTINNNASGFFMNLSANVPQSTGSPPDTPTGLRIGTVTLSSIQVDWAGVSGAASYILYKSDTVDGSYTEIYDGSLTEHDDTGLPSGTTYFYKVSAANVDGASPLSDAVPGTTGAFPGIPQNLRITGITVNSLELTWDAVAGATTYYLYRSETESGQYTTEIYSGSGLSYENTGLTEGLEYFFKVKAENSFGESVLSDPVSGVPGNPPPTPQNLSVDIVGLTSLDLSWDTVTGAVDYHLYRSENIGGPFTETERVYSGTGTSHPDTGLQSNTNYYYKVSSENAQGESALSDPAVQGMTGALPSIPLNLRTTASTGTSIDLAWDTAEGAATYNLTKSSTPDGTYTSIYNAADPIHQDAGLTPNTTYYYKVEGINSFGGSSPSDYLSVTTSAPEIYIYYGTKPSETEVPNESGYDFGTIEADNSSYYDFSAGPVTFTIENMDTAQDALQISSIALSGTNSSEYILVESLPASLAAGANATFTLEFDPVSYGDLSDAALTITTNDPNAPSYVITLQGAGEEPTLGGTITDGTDPVEGAYIRLYNYPTTVDEYAATDAAGYYEFFNIPSGTYFLVVERDGFDPYTQEVTIP